MKKFKLLLPLIGLTALAGMAMPLVGCNKGDEPTPEDTPLCFTTEEESAEISYLSTGLKPGDNETIDIEYKFDDENEWHNWEFTNTTLNVDEYTGNALTITQNKKLYVRNTKDELSKASNSYFSFVADKKKIKAGGNVNSMINNAELSDYCFYRLFLNCSSITTPPQLPSMSLKTRCYFAMFSGCTSLTKAPALPATTLNSYCYEGMFQYCKALTKAPELPSTTLCQECYNHMFKGCDLLTQVPELPAKTLVDYCYGNMFEDCPKLKIEENSSAPGKHLIFMCPETSDHKNPVTDMFKNTGGTFAIGTPTTGSSYYWVE